MIPKKETTSQNNKKRKKRKCLDTLWTGPREKRHQSSARTRASVNTPSPPRHPYATWQTGPLARRPLPSDSPPRPNQSLGEAWSGSKSPKPGGRRRGTRAHPDSSRRLNPWPQVSRRSSPNPHPARLRPVDPQAGPSSTREETNAAVSSCHPWGQLGPAIGMCSGWPRRLEMFGRVPEFEGEGSLGFQLEGRLVWPSGIYPIWFVSRCLLCEYRARNARRAGVIS